jgi:hypothetical protein
MAVQKRDLFRTEFKASVSNSPINHSDSVLTIGSCFSQSMGSKLEGSKFDVLTNPFGTVYNPVSIFTLLSNKTIDQQKFIDRDGAVFHYDFHSDFWAKDEKTLATILKAKQQEVDNFISNVDFIFITLGSAYVYELIETGEIVSNCHKISQKYFRKRLLSIEDMVEAYQNLKSELIVRRRDVKIVLTISPVRHIKDGISENNLSKSLLRVFCDTIVNDIDTFYFPSYEIMMDDLRDYRFYKDDLLHPTSMAEDYIWDKFQKTFFLKDTLELVEKWRAILVALSHRPYNPASDKHQEFLIKQLEKLEHFAQYWDVSKEKTILINQIQD